MRRTPREEAERWLEQARADLRGGEALLAAASYHLACFVAQQVAEKALRAYLYAQGEEFVLGHSVEVLAARAAQYDEAFEELRRRVAALDGYYIPTRYPNGLPDSIPARVYGARNAEDALGLARETLDFVSARVSRIPKGSESA
jgi:HEPN domain-containing protein